jgi:hypothetical protein
MTYLDKTSNGGKWNCIYNGISYVGRKGYCV